MKIKIFLGKATSTIEAFFGIGSMFGPSVGGLFYDLGGFKLPFFFLGGFSLLVSIASLLLFYEEEGNENESNSEENIDVSWLNILKSPGVWAGLLGTTVAAIAWQWYSASVEIYFEARKTFTQTYHLNSIFYRKLLVLLQPKLVLFLCHLGLPTQSQHHQ